MVASAAAVAHHFRRDCTVDVVVVEADNHRHDAARLVVPRDLPIEFAWAAAAVDLPVVPDLGEDMACPLLASYPVDQDRVVDIVVVAAAAAAEVVHSMVHHRAVRKGLADHMVLVVLQVVLPFDLELAEHHIETMSILVVVVVAAAERGNLQTKICPLVLDLTWLVPKYLMIHRLKKKKKSAKKRS